MKTIDFSRSYLRFRVDSLLHPPVTVTHVPPTTLNNVRINLECRVSLIERRSELSHTFVLGASCKTERVGAERDCWLQPNADFCLAASDEEFLILKSWARNGLVDAKDPAAIGVPRERQSGHWRDVFADLSVHARLGRGQALATLEAVIASIQSDRPLVSRIEYEEGDYRVVIEQPVKTINYSEREGVYQTDTGPILLPDLSAERLERCERLIDCFDLAYSAFNSEGWAEFIINVPTPAGHGVTVNHYSRPRRIEPTGNLLVEVCDEERAHLPGMIGDRAIRADAAEARIS
ncbi:MAG: hypothetical protein DCC67_14590 [Planctomycetota bacterium]|nr:MAG: hypothetical protein DCC67_14590 [Planctomycetota bacterium]